jgi:hypothetical protein
LPALRRIFNVFGLVILLAACQEDGPNASNETTPVPDLLRISGEKCEKSGGGWAMAPGKASFVCFRDMRDAGKQCLAESDCEGLCLARSRTCSPIEPFFGCHEVLSSGGVPQSRCLV